MMNCTGAASDVTDTLTDALQVTGLEEARVHYKIDDFWQQLNRF